MSKDIASRLANAMDRQDEEPNVLLADELAQTKDGRGIAQIAEIAAAGRKPAQNDAIKVLYEVGARDAVLLRPHVQLFLKQIHSRNNRMVWGSLTALAQIARIDADPIAENLDSILSAADGGSVIAKDQAVQILIALLRRPDLAAVATAHLFARLQAAAVNQLPMYAERIHAALDRPDQPQFRRILLQRLADDMPPSKRRRIEAVIKKLG